MRSITIRYKMELLFLTITLFPILSIIIYPFVMNIWYSFTDISAFNRDYHFIWFNNFIEFFQSDQFVPLLLRSLIWTGSNTIAMILLGYITALVLITKIKIRIILSSVILIPWIIPEVVSGYTWRWMLDADYGIINKYLSTSGIIDSSTFSWFSNPRLAMTASIIANVWRGSPFIAIMLYSQLKGISTEIIEAAKIDGVSKSQNFWYILFPQTYEILSICSTLAFIWTFNAFGIIYALTGGGPAGATETLPIIIQKTAFRYYEYGKASAIGLVMFCVVFSIIILGKYINKYRKV